MTIKDIIRPFFDEERGDDPWIIDCETASGCPVWNELEKAGVIDVHIIPGTKALVTEKGTKAAAKVLCRDRALEDGCTFDDLWEDGDNAFVLLVRDVLEAAEITIVEGKQSCEEC